MKVKEFIEIFSRTVFVATSYDYGYNPNNYNENRLHDTNEEFTLEQFGSSGFAVCSDAFVFYRNGCKVAEIADLDSLLENEKIMNSKIIEVKKMTLNPCYRTKENYYNNYSEIEFEIE